MFWDKTITLYNKHEDEQTGFIRWFRHTLTNCFVKTTNNKINVGNVQLQTNDTIIRIPKQKDYLLPYEWEQIPNDVKSLKLTIKPGDLIILGDVNDSIDEYTAGHRSSDLIAKYKSLGSVFVNSVNVNDFVMGEHYFVRGE